MPLLRLATLFVVALLVAGCLGATQEPVSSSDPAAPTVLLDESRPDTTFGDVALGPGAGPDMNATLDAPPRLVAGEWWRIQLESPLDGTSSEFVRVVAKVEDDAYLFGMPHEGWWKEAVIYHTPAFGEASRADLSYNTHDEPFTPLKFPLKDGDTWETKFSGGGTLTAHVTVESPTRAVVEFTGARGLLAPLSGGDAPNVVLRLVYDATMHEVVEFQHPTVTFRVVDHGYDYEGWVTVPRGERLVFFHGRIGPGFDFGLQPAAPVETVKVEGGFNRVSFIQVTQPLGPGAYRESAISPAGTEFTTEAVPGTEFSMKFYEERDPDGDWDLTHLAGGPGVVFIEGIAYHQYDIRLPDGAIRTDHSHEVIR